MPLNAQCAGGWGDVLYGWAESRKMALWMSRELGKTADYYEQKQGALAEHLARTARILRERSDSKLQFLYCEAGKAIKICISLSKRYLRGDPESAGTASLLAELRAGRGGDEEQEEEEGWEAGDAGIAEEELESLMVEEEEEKEKQEIQEKEDE